MFQNIDWCDINSDEEFSIPELPPLPVVKSLSFPSAGIDMENQRVSSTTLSETSERSSSAAGLSQRPADGEHGQKNLDRFRFDFAHEKSYKSKWESEYVCFIGKLPQQTTITDVKLFLKSSGINFTDIRMGPKKGSNANVFGYVDLPTKKDYSKLLTLDGLLYEGCRIRINHATHKESSPHRKKTRTRKRNKSSRFRYVRQNSQPRSSDNQQPAWMLQRDSKPIGRKKSQAPVKARTDSGRFASSKPTTFSQMYKTSRPSQKRGPQSRSRYIKSPKIKKTMLRNSTRPLESFDRKKMSTQVQHILE